MTGSNCRFFQASSAEMFGGSQSGKQSEATPFAPKSPYAAAKVFAHHMTMNYREAYGIYASTGILFNHESPLRGLNFVTRKITDAAARIKVGLASVLELGNLNPHRDWGYAKEYVDGFWRALQADIPDDYVLASGQSMSVRDFASIAFRAVGINLEWRGHGDQEIGYSDSDGRTVVRVNRALLRPVEVDSLCGDSGKAYSVLGWRPQTTVGEICEMMVARDLERISKGEWT